MRIKSFEAKSLHGVLNYKLKFDRTLNFLTGINGCGKTSVLNAIVALITPSLQRLSHLRFDSLELEITSEGKPLTISATQENEMITLACSESDSKLKFQRFAVEEYYASYKEQEQEADYYKNIVMQEAAHGVVEIISSLPTPMFLGLDRRAINLDEKMLLGARRTPISRRRRNIFSPSIAVSLRDAVRLAVNKRQESILEVANLGDILRGDLILELLRVEPVSADAGTYSLPTKEDRKNFDKLKKDIRDLDKILDIPQAEIIAQINPLIEALEGYLSKIPTKVVSRNNKPRDLTPPEIEGIVGWGSNRIQLKKIQVLASLVSKFNERRETLLEATESYLALLNKFLSDSGKQVKFAEKGKIFFTLRNFEGERDLDNLSSGEAQIFVILTHLAFHPQAREDNVFIIDEPELSLHVQWQEMFVDSVMSVNPDVQYIMATHSPSIIMERIDSCIDLALN